ncbi:recombinase family protein [Niabella aquatica]
MKKQVGIWIRVSTEDQAKGESPEHHERRARSYAESKDWDVVEVYHLEAVSGKAVLHHPEAVRMLKDIETGKITGLIFSKIARLARNTRELLQISDIFRSFNADLISLQESIDTSSPAGRFFYTLISAMAQWEREEIADRVSASIPIRAKLGKPLGGAAPYGYEWQDKKLIINEEEATVRRLMYDLFLEFKRRKTVANMLNEKGYRTRNGSEFSDTTVLRLLEDPIAKGLRRTNYTESTGDKKQWKLKKKDDWVFQEVPALIDEEKWDKVQSIIKEQSSERKQPLNRKTHLFTGYLTCVCGTKMYTHANTSKYSCTKCKNKIPQDDIEYIFHQQLTDYIASKDNINNFIKTTETYIIEKENQIKVLEREAEKIQSRLDKLIDLHSNREMPTKGFKHHYTPQFERLTQIQNQIPKIEGELLALRQNEESSKYLFSEAENLYNKWETKTRDEKRDIVESVLDSIVIDKEDVVINLKYLMPPSSLSPTNGQHNFRGS